MSKPSHPHGLIKGGVVVDGTGKPAFAADVRFKQGRIVEVGADLETDGDDVFDAAGCYVTPGFIDSHTHYDASLFWDPACDPIAQHGVTTVLIGNCGLGLAPVRRDDIASLSALFSYIEDLPRDLFRTEIPWNWETFPDYASAMRSRRYGVNVAALVSHSLLRLYAMGAEAWSRAATPGERADIARQIEDAMAAGAFGVSTSRFDRSPSGDLVPSYFADGDELDAIFQAVSGHRGIVQLIPDMAVLEQQVLDLRRMAELSQRHATPVISNAIYERPDDPSYAPKLLAAAREMRASGADFHYLASPRSIELLVNFHQCMVFIFVPAWNELVQPDLSKAQKKALLADPAWRARARHDWDAVQEGFPSGGMERLFRIVKVGKPDLESYVGQTFDVILNQHHAHPSDVLADWALENELEAEFVYPFTNTDLGQVGRLLAADESLISGSDAGAHIGMFDGAGDTTLVLTRHVRDRGDLTLESAVRRMTYDQVRLLKLADRGVVAPGAVADIAVFDLQRLEWRREIKVNDVPGGQARFRRGADGFRYTFVGGELVQQAGRSTGALPARFLSAEDRARRQGA
jgi:N-acyl-D-aspartate/D-glutamate deacylase